MSAQPTLSVMMPNYNHAHFVVAALDAIFTQGYEPLEVVVLDDASTDNSRAVLEAYAARERRLRLVFNERNAGVNAGLTKLVEMARGTHVFLPAADDLILPGFFDACMSLIAKYPQAGLCTTATLIIDEHGRRAGALGPDRLRRGSPGFIPPMRARKLLLRYGSWMFGNTAVFRKDALIMIGGHRPDLASYADGFAHELLARQFGACYVPVPLTAWRRQAVTYSTQANRDKFTVAKMRDTAVSLMRGEFADLFSEEYVQRWLGRWRFSVLQQMATSDRGELSAWLDIILGSTHRGARAAILSAASLGPKAVIAAAAVAFRRADILWSAWSRLLQPLI